MWWNPPQLKGFLHVHACLEANVFLFMQAASVCLCSLVDTYITVQQRSPNTLCKPRQLALSAPQARAVKHAGLCSTPWPLLQEQQINFETMCYFVDNVVHSVSQTYLPGGRRQPGMVIATDPGTVTSIVDKLESMFQVLLGLHFHQPIMVTYFAKVLEAFSRLLALRRHLASPSIAKVGLPLEPLVNPTLGYSAAKRC